jgi:hypothetical protein
MQPRSLSYLLVIAAGLVAATMLGCPKQGEGERCSVLAGRSGEDSDCDEGLVCKPGSELGLTGDICCPEVGGTHPACLAPPPGTGGAGTGGTTSTGGAGGTGGQGGSGGTGGTGGGGMGGDGGGGTSAGGNGGGGNGGTGG